jgi:hypothetical protein
MKPIEKAILAIRAVIKDRTSGKYKIVEKNWIMKLLNK